MGRADPSRRVGGLLDSRRSLATMRSSPTKLLVGLGLCALVACGDAASNAPAARGAASTPHSVAQDEEGPLVVFLGDSLSAGLHLDAEEAFPAVLQRRMAEEGLPFRLVNAGVSGDTTAGGLRRLDWLLAQDPDYVVVELGANDGLRGVPLSSVESNLRGILEALAASDARAILLGLKLPPNYGLGYATDFEAIYHRLADEFDPVFVPFFLEGVGGVPELNLPDGLHPTAEGHERIAEHLLPTFVEALGE